MTRSGAAAPAADPSDAEIVKRVRAGERDAYRIVVTRYQDGLFRYALRMTGSSDVASDLVQAALVKGYVRLRSCREPERFQAWLFRILVNGCKDWLKSGRRRDVGLDAIGPTRAATKEDPEHRLGQLELRHALEQALAALPDVQREAFLLKHVEGLSYEEMAERCGASLSALKMRVMRAREALRENLERTEHAP
ncbi:MAG: RNA polymerase sigma factor [Longimicrobiales bacterium]